MLTHRAVGSRTMQQHWRLQANEHCPLTGGWKGQGLEAKATCLEDGGLKQQLQQAPAGAAAAVDRAPMRQTAASAAAAPCDGPMPGAPNP
jgi:hypothetical protein